MRQEMLRWMCACVALVTFAAPAWAVCDAAKGAIIEYELKGAEAYDKNTGLTWARCSLGQTWHEAKGCDGEIRGMTWGEAMKQTPDDGWRIPTLDELKTLVSPGCKKPALNDAVFPDMRVERMLYWSSTPFNKSTSWTVDFFDGVAGPYNSISTPTPGALRFVKGGK